MSVWEEGQNGQLWQAGDLWRGCHPGPEGGASLHQGYSGIKVELKKSGGSRSRGCASGLSKEQ